jgi:hypothetical protein
MKKDSKQRLFEIMSRLDKTFKPKLNENVESTYEKVDIRGHLIEDDAMDYIGDKILDNVDSYYLIYGGLQNFDIKDVNLKDIELFLNDRKNTFVKKINIDRVVGSMYAESESELEQKGGLETEPIQGYWTGMVSLNEISLIDDMNNIIYLIPQDDYQFNRISKYIAEKAENEFDEEWIKNHYNPY